MSDQPGRFAPKWLDNLLDKLELAPHRIYTLFAICLNPHKFKVWVFGDNPQSLFMNGLFYFRFTLPFHVALMVRWSADAKRAYLQTHFGFRPVDGRLACVFRIQGDASPSKQGGLVTGWDTGPI